MSNHLKTLGFPFERLEEFEELVRVTLEHGEQIVLDEGAYVVWSPGEGIELWAMVVPDEELIWCTPFWRGPVRLEVHAPQLEAIEERGLEGVLVGRRAGGQEVAVQVPDFGLLGELEGRAQVGAACFVHEVELVDAPEGSARLERAPGTEPGEAMVQLAGEIVGVEQRRNASTRRSFWRLEVAVDDDTIVDVLGSSGQLGRRPRRGRWVEGTGWLCGALVEGDADE